MIKHCPQILASEGKATTTITTAAWNVCGLIKSRTARDLTRDERETPHGRKGVNSRRVEDVEPIGDAANPVHLSVKVLNRRRVVVVVAVEEKALGQRRFAHLQ